MFGQRIVSTEMSCLFRKWMRTKIIPPSQVSFQCIVDNCFEDPVGKRNWRGNWHPPTYRHCNLEVQLMFMTQRKDCQVRVDGLLFSTEKSTSRQWRGRVRSNAGQRHWYLSRYNSNPSTDQCSDVILNDSDNEDLPLTDSDLSRRVICEYDPLEQRSMNSSSSRSKDDIVIEIKYDLSPTIKSPSTSDTYWSNSKSLTAASPWDLTYTRHSPIHIVQRHSSVRRPQRCPVRTEKQISLWLTRRVAVPMFAETPT